jgi:nitrogen regulatory protein P-II 1
VAQLIGMVVHDPAQVDEVLHAWIDSGVTGLTVLDSSGLAHHMLHHGMRDDLPLMPSVRKMLKGAEHYNRTIFSIVDDGFDVDRLIAATEKITGPLTNPDTGILFVVPLARVLGISGPVGGRPPSAE